MTTLFPGQPSVTDLRAIGLFGALSDDVLRHFSAALTVQVIETGITLFREGEDGREMFVVLQGELEILKRSHRGTDARVALLGPGDWVGDMSIVDIQPRSATVRALAPTRLLRVTAADLDNVYRNDLKAYSIVILNLARELSRRLRVTDGILADLIASVFDEVIARRLGPSKP
jgi:CRP/FNR family transcriptional regulator, cyclic AMP receptor protein